MEWDSRFWRRPTQPPKFAKFNSSHIPCGYSCRGLIGVLISGIREVYGCTKFTGNSLRALKTHMKKDLKECANPEPVRHNGSPQIRPESAPLTEAHWKAINALGVISNQIIHGPRIVINSAGSIAILFPTGDRELDRAIRVERE